MSNALADIFAAVRLTLDGTGFEAQATALATKSGQNAGTALSQQLSSKLKSAAAGAMGALAGAGLASAISGATQLNELAGEYQVQTGASAAEAKAFESTLNNLFKTSHQGYDEIAQTLIGLKTHFDLSGQAAATLGANILDFAEIAGGGGAAAVERLNSLVKTGVIAQADMSATMDKLTVAHQKWGININETLDSLTKFAPAMNAFGMSTDQAIAWMSIFNKAGVDSQRVVMGFNTALQKVKTPEQFNALIAKIAATPDDLERAKLAVSLFGARAGAALANMLRPGTQSIADMTAVIGTDYVGAVQEAAYANDHTFGGAALLMLHQFQGALADVALSMGTSADAVLMAAALLGPQLTRGILAGLGGLAGLFGTKLLASLVPEGIAAGTTAGAATGTAFGFAIGPAMALAIPAAVLIGLEAAKPTIQKWFSDMGLKVPDLFGNGGALAPPIPMKSGTGANYRQAWVDAGLESGSAFGTAATDGVTTGVKSGMNTVTTAVGGITRGMQSGIMQGMAAFGNLGAVAVKDLIATFGTGMKGVWDAAHNLGHATGVEGMLTMAQGIEAARAVPLDAFTTMVTMMKTALTPSAEAARLAGELTSTQLVAGLRSKDPAVAAQAIAVKEAILDRLAKIAQESGPIGKKAMDELAAGMKSKDIDIRTMATSAHDIVIAELNKTPADAATAGANTATAFSASFAAGLKAMNANLPGWLATWLGIAGSAPKGYTPPPAVVLGGGRASGGLVAAGMPYIVGERRPELFVPQTNGYIVPSVPGGNGQTININGPIQLADAHDQFSLVQQLRFLAQVTA